MSSHVVMVIGEPFNWGIGVYIVRECTETKASSGNDAEMLHLNQPRRRG